MPKHNARKDDANRRKTAVIYARYSSHSQRDCSIEQQIDDCQHYAMLNNLNVVGVYADRSVSGTTDKRPQFQQMLKDSAKEEWDYLICWKIDRFARNRYDSATYKFRLKKHGVQVLYAKESIPDGPEGILLESILEGSAEYYSANLSQNIKRGMEYNAQQGKVNSGYLPFGYKKGADGKFAVDPFTAEIVVEIFQKTLDGVPFNTIATDLNERGIKTSRGNPWNRSSFHRMLVNENYIGTYSWGGVTLENGMPQIVPDELFREVQKILKTKKNPQGKQRVNADYLLTGKLKCGYCDSYMIGYSGTSKRGTSHYYYGCRGRRVEHRCHKENVSRDYIETLVVQKTIDYISSPPVAKWIVDSIYSFSVSESRSSRVIDLEAKLKETENSIQNLMLAIEAGIITKSTKNRLLQLEEQQQEIVDQLAKEKARSAPLKPEVIVAWLRHFQNGDVHDHDFKRSVIDSFVSAVYLTDDDLRIVFNYSRSGKPDAASFDFCTQEFDGENDCTEAAGVRKSTPQLHHMKRHANTGHGERIIFKDGYFIIIVPLR